jgi:hypothetical protein
MAMRIDDAGRRRNVLASRLGRSQSGDLKIQTAKHAKHAKGSPHDLRHLCLVSMLLASLAILAVKWTAPAART